MSRFPSTTRLDDTSSRPGEISRRRALSIAAWSVPVIAVAVATPQAAASVALTMTLSSGDVSPDGGSTRFEGVIRGDQVPLIVTVTTSTGSPPTGSPSATLTGAPGIAEWSPGTGSGDTAIGDLVGEEAIFGLDILGYGTFSVTISLGGQTWVFSVTIAA